MTQKDSLDGKVKAQFRETEVSDPINMLFDTILQAYDYWQSEKYESLTILNSSIFQVIEFFKNKKVGRIKLSAMKDYVTVSQESLLIALDSTLKICIEDDSEQAHYLLSFYLTEPVVFINYFES